MARRRRKKIAAREIDSSSMADIAFLLLIFFLVTTTVLNEKGIWYTLPKKPKKDIVEQDDIILERNMFKVILNSNNGLLVGSNIVELDQVRERARQFIDNRGADPLLSENPKEAILSYRSDRGTDAQTYIYVLDALLGAYTDLRADFLDISSDQYLKLDKNIPEDAAMIKKAEKEYPFKLSEAKPSGEK